MQIITEMSTSEMVAEYNQLTGKSIKKFSDRKTGERQLASARQMAETKSLLSGTTSKPTSKCKRPMTSVVVGDEHYRSVLAAFTALDLPVNKHGKFRLALKASGKATIENEGKEYHFSIAERKD